MPDAYFQQPPEIVTWNVSPNVWGTAICIGLAMVVALALIGLGK